MPILIPSLPILCLVWGSLTLACILAHRAWILTASGLRQTRYTIRKIQKARKAKQKQQITDAAWAWFAAGNLCDTHTDLS